MKEVLTLERLVLTVVISVLPFFTEGYRGRVNVNGVDDGFFSFSCVIESVLLYVRVYN